jgi:nucleoside 2-deoxyribosyltransferase
MKIYIAGKLCSESEKEFLEKIAYLCESLGFDTFLPHRDVGLASGIDDVERIFKGDIEKGFKDVDLVVADLNGLHVGAGTSWELGYAYAKGIPCIGIKTDESISDALDSLSAILIHSIDIVENFEDLNNKLEIFNLKSE